MTQDISELEVGKIESEDVLVRTSDIDPGPLIEDPERIKNLSAIELYYHIDKYYKRAFGVNFDFSNGNYYQGNQKAFEKDLQAATSAYFFCIDQTRKFGTGVGRPKEGEEFDWGIEYFRWEKFHANFIREIPSEKRDLFKQAMETGEGVEMFQPKEDWRDYKLSRSDMKQFRRMMSVSLEKYQRPQKDS